jgi:hypothetical protein
MFLIACMQVTPEDADLLQQIQATRQADPAALDAVKDCLRPAGQAFRGGLSPADVSPQAKARRGSIAGNRLDMTDRTHSAAHRQGSPQPMEGLVSASEGRAVGPTVASRRVPPLPVAHAAELQGKGPHGDAASAALQRMDHVVPGYADAGSRGKRAPAGTSPRSRGKQQFEGLRMAEEVGHSQESQKIADGHEMWSCLTF